MLFQQNLNLFNTFALQLIGSTIVGLFWSISGSIKWQRSRWQVIQCLSSRTRRFQSCEETTWRSVVWLEETCKLICGSSCADIRFWRHNGIPAFPEWLSCLLLLIRLDINVGLLTREENRVQRRRVQFHVRFFFGRLGTIKQWHRKNVCRLNSNGIRKGKYHRELQFLPYVLRGWTKIDFQKSFVSNILANIFFRNENNVLIIFDYEIAINLVNIQ